MGRPDDSRTSTKTEARKISARIVYLTGALYIVSRIQSSKKFVGKSIPVAVSLYEVLSRWKIIQSGQQIYPAYQLVQSSGNPSNSSR